MKARKSLGQHFLTSPQIARRIVRAGEVRRSDTVLEVGPGTGMLTEALLETGAKVLAIEKDPRAIEILSNKFKDASSEGRLKIIQGDALDFSLRAAEIPRHYKVISNIPYYITGALIRKFLEAEHQPETIVFLVQKEVAERIAREKKASLLSVSVKAYGSPQYVETIKARFFKPIPKVDSAILLISGISKQFFKNIDESTFFEIAKHAFSKKRKILVSNLAPLMPKRDLEALFASLQINPRIRAEDASMELWRTLAEKIGARS